MDLNDELRSHLEMRAAELEAAGLSKAEAYEEARRRFGSVESIREETRDRNVNRHLEAFWQDARYGCRVLARQPGFASAAILTLAIAIGANGAIFSALEAVLFRPLPFPHADQLVFVWGKDAQHKRWSIAPADLEDWRKGKSFQSIAAVQAQSVNLTGIDEPTRVIGAFVSSEYFPILGVGATMGRTFATEEDQPGGARVAVVSHAFWQNRFGGDPGFLGRKLIFNGEPFTAIGVLPADFAPPWLGAEVWLPSHVYPNYTRDRAQTCVFAIARLSAGAPLGQAQAELDTMTRQLEQAYPATNRGRGATLIPVRDMIVEDVKPALWSLAAAVCCLLVIACANIANLLLSKAAGRRQEIAIRAALGAGRMRIVRQLLTESVVLAASGAGLGVGVAYLLARYISRKLQSWPDSVAVQLNWMVLGFMAVAAIAAALLFGLAPALMARRAAPESTRVRGDIGRTRLRSVLAAGQVALALVLLIGAGLMIESLKRLLNVDVGFDGRNVLTMEYRLPRNKYPKPQQQARFHAEAVARIQALPGVESAATVRALPFSGNGGTIQFGLGDRPAPPPSSPYIAQYNTASPAYFETVRIPLRAGRGFRDSDDTNAPWVVVVSDSFARRYWPEGGAVGRQVLLPAGKNQMAPATVVGVVGNMRHDRLDEAGLPQVYAPDAQDPFIFATLVVRTRGNPLDRVKDVQRAVWSVDKDQPMWKVRTLDSLVDASLGGRRVVLTLVSSFSGVALFLAGLGLYGVISYQVTRRTAEFGVRVAMGAAPGDILRMVLGQGLVLAGAGVGAGLAAAPLFGSILKSQLFGVNAADPLVYAVLSGVLLAISAVAVLLPARRATRLDAMQALRME